MEMDFDDDFKMTSNSSDVIEGISAATAVVESVRKGADKILERMARR
jgi:hypothetical protein